MSPIEDADDDAELMASFEPGLDTIERSERSLLVLFGVMACFIGLALIIWQISLLPLFFRLMFGLLLLAIGMYNILLGLSLVSPPPSTNSNRARLVVGERLLVGLFATIVLLGGAVVLVADTSLVPRLLLSGMAFIVGTLCVLIAAGAVTPPDTTSDDYRLSMRRVDARKHGRPFRRDGELPEQQPASRRKSPRR